MDFKLVRSHMTEYYIAENGDHVAIDIAPDDTAALIVCHAINNKCWFNKKYKSRRAALIAMHKRCGKCRFTQMTNTYVRG